MTFGEKLKEIREEKNYSKYMLSVKSHISPGEITALEEGKRNPHPKTIKRLADALGCSYEELFGLADNKG